MAEPKVEVVISGIGGIFPECDNLDELKNLLFEKRNAVSSDSRRWSPGLLGTPHGVGKLRNPSKFDSVFFGIHRKMTDSLDALTRLSLERSVEAIVDAGINPSDLSGTNTGVFMNSCVSESEFFEICNSTLRGFGILGHNRAMQANRLSYSLNLNGPSYTTDATWVGGSQALMRAKKMIEDGVINAAIIGSCNLCMNPSVSLQLEGLGKLTQTTETRSFSEDANGMNRSESCVSIVLQKASEAKRSYGTLLNATGLFGETDDLLCHYSNKHYKEVLINAYKEAKVDPGKVAYIEGEGLAIKKVDAMELNALSDVFCIPSRRQSLKVGSIKSNVGHCEAASSLVSLAKALIILDSGYIPPNINFSGPNPDCPALFSGNLEVVTEKIPLEGDIIGVSSFGLCNSFSHIILKQNKKGKTETYDKGEMFKDGLPRLIFISGRNEESLRQIIERIKNSRMNEEFAALLQGVFYKPMNAHFFKNFIIFPELDEGVEEEISYRPDVSKRPIWFIFSGMGSQWHGMGKQLLNIPIFAETIRKCEAVLKPKGVDIINILTSEDPTLFDNVLNSFVGIAAIQIGLVDILKALDIVPDGIVGHSVGELGCAYADGCFTAEQMILASHARGRASIETELIDGSMAAVGLGYNAIKDRLPNDIEVACHNASDSSTLSGPTASVNSFVEQLKSEGVFAKVVNVSNIAYHSQYIKPAAPTLLKYLKEVIPESKPRSSKWISSSIPESEWGSELAQTSSPEYHTNNLLGQVLFEEASKHIPDEAIAIEIAPHGLLQAILKRSLPSRVTNIPLTHRSTKDSVRFLLNAFGKMYNNGMSPNIEAFYPPVNYPVGRETPCLNSLLSWDHRENWVLKGMTQGTTRVSGEGTFYICLDSTNNLADYKIFGRNILPNAIILLNIWKSFILIKNEMNLDEPIGFQDLNFIKNIEIAPNETLEFYSLIQCGSGRFEVCLGNDVIVTGKVYRPDAMYMAQNSKKMKYPSIVSDLPHSSISNHDLYTLLEHNGYDIGSTFRTVSNINLHFEELRGNVKWDNDWMNFFNGIFTFVIYKSMENNDNPAEISTIREMWIDPSKFRDNIDKDIPVYYNLTTNELHIDGIYILHPEVKPLTINGLNPFVLRLEEERFIKLSNPDFDNESNFISNCVQIIFESKKYQLNINEIKFNIYYTNENQISQYITLMKQMFDNELGIQHSIEILDQFNPKMLIKKEYFIGIMTKNKMLNVMSTFKNTKKTHLLVLSDEPLHSNKEWTVIIQQEFNGRNLVLIKKIIKKKVVNFSVDNLSALKSFNNDIKVFLAECKKTKSYFCVFTQIVPYVKLTRFVEDVLLKNKSTITRFFFILDKSAPNFNVENPFYASQLHKNLFINIYKDGEWGTITRNVIGNFNSNTSSDDDSSILFNSITLDDIKVKYLGINFQDITVNNDANNELGHLEYSGVTLEGKRIMGIAPFGKNASKQIYPDPYLSWVIPSDWSLEDAATVPLSYSLAYYILNIMITPKDKLKTNTILVHAGFNPVGQAAIAIALAAGKTVYVTVENDEQAKLLINKFPSLHKSRILNYKNDNFEVQILMATNGEGISIILNCLNGNDFQSSTRVISKFGKFFQLTKTDMKNKDKLGMLFFLRNISFYGVSPDGLLATNIETKLKLQNEVQKGINLGIVKPFDRHVLTGSCTGKRALQTLNSYFQEIESKRVVLSLEIEKSMKSLDYEKYQCNSDKVYMIVGSKYSTWIDLAEWLVIRGARKIVVTLKNYAMSTTASRRFNLLMARYQNTSIQIITDASFTLKNDIIKFFKDITMATLLGGIFYATMNEEKDKIRNIQYAIEHIPSLKVSKPLFVCFMSGGEEICAELRDSGICPNAISLSWSLLTEEPKFSNLITSLDSILINLNKIVSSSIICTEYHKELVAGREFYSNMIAELPASIDELNTLGATITEEPEFVERFTKSPRFGDITECLPIFIVPGFRPERLNKIYEHLIYPTFEARLPETIISLENVATKLVQSLKKITKCGNVSLVGISWGGAVCLLMAQILESENIAISLTLVEGIPSIIQEWTSSLLQYGSINTKLVLNYFPVNHMIAKDLATNDGWKTTLQEVLSSNNVEDTIKTTKAFNTIRSCLNAIFKIKPLSNKIIAKINVINRNINVDKSSITNLSDYCVYPPTTFTLVGKDYDATLSKEVAQIINKNILHYHPDATVISITDLYARNNIDTLGFNYFFKE